MSFEEYKEEEYVGRGGFEPWLIEHSCSTVTCNDRGNPFPESLLDEVLDALFVQLYARAGILRYLTEDHGCYFKEGAVNSFYYRIRDQKNPKLMKRIDELVLEKQELMFDSSEMEEIQAITASSEFIPS